MEDCGINNLNVERVTVMGRPIGGSGGGFRPTRPSGGGGGRSMGGGSMGGGRPSGGGHRPPPPPPRPPRRPPPPRYGMGYGAPPPPPRGGYRRSGGGCLSGIISLVMLFVLVGGLFALNSCLNIVSCLSCSSCGKNNTTDYDKPPSSMPESLGQGNQNNNDTQLTVAKNSPANPFNADCVIDETGWFENPTKLGKDLEFFYTEYSRMWFSRRLTAALPQIRSGKATVRSGTSKTSRIMIRSS